MFYYLPCLRKSWLRLDIAIQGYLKAEAENDRKEEAKLEAEALEEWRDSKEEEEALAAQIKAEVEAEIKAYEEYQQKRAEQIQGSEER